MAKVPTRDPTWFMEKYKKDCYNGFLMNERIELSRKVKNLFREYQQYRPKNEIALAYATFNAFLNVAQALTGRISERKILEALDSAKSPNRLSRAVRTRLPHIQY